MLAGSRSWTLSAVAATLAGRTDSRVVSLSERDIGAHSLPVSDGARLLGSELDGLIYDAYCGFDPDSFGAALGALRGGALLILLTPDLTRWPQLPDPQAARIAVHPFTSAQVQTRFIRRLARIVADAPGVFLVSQFEPIPSPPPRPDCPTNPAPEVTGDCRTRDQQVAVESILKMADARARRPLILRSDRGRGKSSALGIAAARMLARGRRNILVTAPRRSAVEPIFHHASRLLPNAHIRANRISFGDARIEFVPPDKLCRLPHCTDLLLVDEAAGIPAPLLGQLLKEHPRVVFATTVHGYEGTGRGFELRFRRTLDELPQGWREIRLETPIRWARNDPLERLGCHALLLDANPADESMLGSAYPRTCRFHRLDRDALADDDVTLSRLFGMLVLAHYQTRPMDLRQLLDGPNLRVYALVHKKQIVATALVANEGGFGPDLADEIFAGRRRPRGHLLPQTLSAHAGIAEATRLRCARVIRIAVHPAARGRGLGRLLLNGIVRDAREQRLDLAGSSFGASGDLLDFWKRCDFPAVHLGTSRNAASGAHAAVVLMPLSKAGKALQALALKRLGQRLPWLLPGPFKDLESQIAARLLGNVPAGDWIPDPREGRELVEFAYGLRPYEAVLPLLARLASTRLGGAALAGTLDASECDVLICKVLQHRRWEEVARLVGVTGRARVIALLRRAAGKLIEPPPPGDSES